jgi:pSer/pThr/pTyr-binding forkhead associated (FHA) protein
MGGLQRFERKLESAISTVFARAFRSAVQPVEIAAALQREVDSNTQILSRDRRLAPNNFHVELSQADMERLTPYDSAIARDLAEQLEDHADAQSYVFPGPVRIEFAQADDLDTGRFRVASRPMASVSGQGTTDPYLGHRASLEINGTSHPVSAPGVIVGRGHEAHIRINDPGISRRHVEFAVTVGRVEDGSPLRLIARDLGSTNGMLVDGHRASKVAVGHGSRIQVGNTEIVVRLHPAEDQTESGADV